MKRMCLVLVGYAGCIFADSVVLPNVQEYDLSAVPPSATELLRQERKNNQAQEQTHFEQTVAKVVAQKLQEHRKRSKKRSSTKSSVKKQSVKNAMTTALNALALQQAYVAQDMVDILEKQLDDNELRHKHVSMTLKSMPVRDALILLSKSTGMQMVIDNDVSGAIKEIKLDNIPLAAALHSILGGNDPRLTIMKNFGVWRVLKMQTARELFAGNAARQREKDFKASVYQIKYAKWDDALKVRLEKLWQGITQATTDKQHTYMVMDDVNHKVLFKGRGWQADEFEFYVRELDVFIPQIKIDARVVIASKDFEEALGFRWSGIYNRRASVRHFDFVGVGPVNNKTGDGTDMDTPFNNIIGWSLNFIPSNIKTTLANIPFVFGNNDMNTKRLNLELTAAENRNEIETILKPSLLVFNEEVAEILVGQELPHEVRLDETIESRLTNITTVNYKDVGMKIKVKPVVVPGHQAVFLDVFVENSFIAMPDFALVQGAGSGNSVGSTRSSFNYTIKTSRSKNRVLLKSGQTTLIGGLMSNTKINAKTGVPILQDIPVLGWFFKGSRKQKTDEQLMIFITPTLVEA